MKITVSLIITCVIMSLLWHKLCEMEGFQPITPVKEIPRVSTLLSTKNRAWRWCMVCNAVLKTNYRSFSYGLQNAEELVQRLSRALDTDIRFSNCRPKHFNKSTYHFLMQWLSSTKIPHINSTGKQPGYCDITIAILDGEPAWIWRKKAQQKGAAWKITDFLNPVGKFTNTPCPLARCIHSTEHTRPSGVGY